MLPDEPEPRCWLELPRARDLYELVCESPADDGPRRVLADYLLEHEHPRGELIALSLAGPGGRTPELLPRSGELLAAHGRRWLSPLGAVIPETGARWERGFSRARTCTSRASRPMRCAPRRCGAPWRSSASCAAI